MSYYVETKCKGGDCKSKERCRRFTASGSEYQWYAEFFKDAENCQHYLQDTKAALVTTGLLKK